jgi:DNA polymerase II large subunit
MNAPSSGMMRWNGNNNSIEVFDGGMNLWQQMYGKTADIQLSGDITVTVEWAKKKMAEESEWEKLAKTNDAVKIALENMKKAKQQLDITAKLVKDHNETTS